MRIALIAAMDINRVIGSENSIPWNLPRDMKHFIDTTKNKMVIMGRKTHESIGKPLPNRTNVILTRDKDYVSEGCTVVHSMEDALAVAEKANQSEPNHITEVMVIGGEEIYRQFLPIADTLYLTIIEGKFSGEAVFPEINQSEWYTQSMVKHAADEKNAFDMKFLKLVRLE